jgi:hypothetical protein
MGYTVAFGAYGSAFTFKKSKLKRSNGTLEYNKYLKALCAIPNIDTVYLLSPSDYYTAPYDDVKDIDPKGKLEIIWTDKVTRPARMFKDLSGHDMNTMPDDIRTYLQKNTKYDCVGAVQREAAKITAKGMEGKHIDQIILYMSQGVSNWNVPDSKMTKFGYGNQSMMMGVNYTAHISYFLNTRLDVPYYLILPDPRWGGGSKWGILIDNFKSANAVLTQYNSDMEWRHVTEYDNKKRTTDFKYEYDKIKFQYKQAEKVSSIGVEPSSPNSERKNDFAVVAMQSTPEAKWKDDYRYKELQKWVLNIDSAKDWSIYGKWSPEVMKKYNNFKGMITGDQIDDIFADTKYTLIVPIAKNWVTSKYVEMLATGTVPFFHPDYDTQYHILEKGHFLRVTSPKDLEKKINFLNKYPEERFKLVEEFQEKVFGNTTNGHVIAEMLNETNKEQNIDIEYDMPKIKKRKNKMNLLFG